MATVIDKLVIELGLDPKKLQEEGKLIVVVFNKTKNEVEKSSKGIENSAQKAADSISRLTSRVLGLYAAFLGARSLKDFIVDMNTANAALGRFAVNMQESPQTIAAWGMAAQRMGGSGEAVAATFDRIGKSLYELKQNGQMLPKEFAQLQGLTGMRIDTDKGVSKFLEDTSAALKRMSELDPSKTKFLAEGIGIDPGTLAVMTKYGAEVGKYLETLKKNAPSDEAIKAAQKMQEQWASLQQTAQGLANEIMTTLAPEIDKILKQMTAWVEKNQDWLRTEIVDAVKKFALYLSQIDWNAVGHGLQEFANGAKEVADAVGGIQNALIGLFALWAGSKAISFFNGMKGLLGSGAGSTGAASSASSGAALGMGALGLGAALTLGRGGELKKNAGMKEFLRSQVGSSSNQPDYNSLTRDPSLHGEALTETKVDGRPVSKSNPMPVVIDETKASPGFLESLWNGVTSAFGVAAAHAGEMPASRRGGGSRDIDDSGIPNGSPSTANRGNAKRLMDRLVGKHGWTPQAAAIAAGNAEAESSFNPGSMGDPQVPGGSWGLFQWNRSRLSKLKKFAAATGKDWKDFNVQVDYFAQEANEMIPSWKSKTSLSGADEIGKRFEGYAGPIQLKRSRSAANYLKGYEPPQPVPNGVLTGASGAAAMGAVNNNTTSNSSSVNATIGTMNVNAPNATDANGIAGGMVDSMRNTIPALSNYGPR